MKFLIFVTLFFVSSNALSTKIVQDFMEKVTKFGETCIEETKASSEDITQLMSHQIPLTHEGKCMISCVYKKFKIQNEDGTMNKDETLKLMQAVKEDDPELYKKMEAILEICHKPAFVVEDHCMTGVNVATCAVIEGKKVGISSEMFGV